MIKTITKRDGTIKKYDIIKIENVLKKAFNNTNITCNNLPEILQYVDKELENKNNYNIEEIQDLVEKTLMIYKYFETAKHYINYREAHNKNRDNTSYLSKIPDNVITPWGMLGYITYKRTYARRLNESNDLDETTEEYRDTILRILNGCQKQLNVNFTNIELEKAYKYLMGLKCSVAGRFLWQLGTETVSKLGIMSLQNCAFVKIDDPIKPFLWIFDVLMLGTGVGFNIQQCNIKKLPPILDVDIVITRQDTKDADFIVPDSREGWVSLLEKVLDTYFNKGKSFTYSTVLIRSAGTKIKGFGGVASGPEDLVKGINYIQTILNKRKGSYLTSIDCLDIVNIIASVVVAGNVRRCLPMGSKVHTKDGLINIEDIVVGDEVLTTKGYKKVKNVFKQGLQDVYKIITSNGSFRCTKNHKMAVYDNTTSNPNKTYKWITAENLKQGDNLILSKDGIEGNSNVKIMSFTHSNRLDRINTPELNEDISWLFGLFSQNAVMNLNECSLTIDCKSNELLNKILNIMKYFGNSIRTITDIDINKNIYKLELISMHFFNYINGYLKTYIPYFINETTLINRIAFISGIIESSVSEINEYKIKINNLISEKYAYDLSCLMFSCGIVNNVNKICITISDKYSFNILNKNTYINKNIPNIEVGEESYKYINNCKVELSSVECMQFDAKYTTYDIEVEDVHEFFCNGYLTHNSALICLGDYDDVDYLNAKRWDLGNIPNWRCMSNNSVVCDDINKLPDEFWNGYNGNGEPYGLINIELSRKIGRVKDGEKYPDPTVEGYNPCLTDDTIIMTNEGLFEIKDLINKPFEAIINGTVYKSTEKGFWHSGKKEVYKITLSNGTTIKATDNHKFKSDNVWKEVKDMKPNDYLTLSDNTNFKWSGGEGTENEGYTIGHILSQGKIIDNCDDINKLTLFMKLPKICKTLEEYKPYTIIKDAIDNDDISSDYVVSNDEKLDYNLYSLKSANINKIASKFNITTTDNYLLKNKSYNFTIGLLKAFFDVIGYIESNIKLRSIRLAYYDLNKLKLIQTLLYSVGINNNIITYPTYNELFIVGESIIKFNDIIGFNDNKKYIEIKEILSSCYSKGFYINQFTSKIISIEKEPELYDVYDCTIDDDSHSFTANNLISHNCAEQSLANYETCCLSEIYLCNIDNYEELKDIATIVYRICKHSLLLKCHQKETELIVHKNLRMGIGITGYLQSTETQKGWLSDLYEYLRDYDKHYSQKLGVPISVKITTVKPSGTLSLLAGVTSGAHPAIYQHFIRRIRISSSNTTLIELAKKNNYFVEYQKNFDGSDDKNTMIIEFPCCYPEGTVLAKNMSAVDQLNTIKELQTNWSDNAVSVTVYYKLHELSEIKEWLKNNFNFNVKSCSFLLHNDHGFKQAPFEEITREKYEELMKITIPITACKIAAIKDNELSSDCVGGAGPIR